MTLHLTEMTSGDENWVIIDIDCDRSDMMHERGALSPLVFTQKKFVVCGRHPGAWTPVCRFVITAGSVMEKTQGLDRIELAKFLSSLQAAGDFRALS